MSTGQTALHFVNRSFSPGKRFPVYDFTFDLQSSEGGRVGTSIEVRQGSKPVQRLRVAGIQPLGEGAEIFLSAVDINFDGLLDLMLIVRRGVANAYAKYWLFQPRSGKFAPFGSYPVFQVDPGRRRLSTYERGGSAGLIHQAREYSFVKGKLTLLRDEKQVATKNPVVFSKVVKERVKGSMQVVSRETVLVELPLSQGGKKRQSRGQ